MALMRRSHSLANNRHGAFDVSQVPKGLRSLAPTTTGLAPPAVSNKELIFGEVYWFLFEGNVVDIAALPAEVLAKQHHSSVCRSFAIQQV